MEDLAPMHYRQRLIVEGTCDRPIEAKDIERYLSELSDVLHMRTLAHPVTHQSPTYGWAGWIHWETSGCHFYAWDEPYPFYSADIYTCKKFSPDEAVSFTEKFFVATKIAWREA